MSSYCHVFFYSCSAKESSEFGEEDDEVSSGQSNTFARRMAVRTGISSISASAPIAGGVDNRVADECVGIDDNGYDDAEEKKAAWCKLLAKLATLHQRFQCSSSPYAGCGHAVAT